MKAPYDKNADQLTVKKWAWENRVAHRLVANGECLDWPGGFNKDGYGKITLYVEGRPRGFTLHRLALEVSRGRLLDPGKCSLHSCDRPQCCNPAHLFEGTNVENTRDRDAKGRCGRMVGEANPSAKLTAEKVRMLREIAPGNRGVLTEFARREGVSVSVASLALNGKTWRSA